MAEANKLDAATSDLLDSMLDMDIEDLQDLPEFIIPPVGVYKATVVDFGKVLLGEHPAMQITLRLTETVELVDPSEAPVPAGTEVKEAFMMDSEFGQGGLKNLVKGLKANMGELPNNSVAAVIGGCVGGEFIIRSGIRVNKKAVPVQKYFKIDEILG